MGLPGGEELFVVAFELSEDVQMQPYTSYESHRGLVEDVRSIIVAWGIPRGEAATQECGRTRPFSGRWVSLADF